MSRLKFDPFAVENYPTLGDFPNPGRAGYLYKDQSTGIVYEYDGASYTVFNSHAIISESGSPMPQRKALQFDSAGIKVTDDEAEGKTVVSFEYLKPFRPQPLSPENGTADMALFVRLKITPYEHPIGIPIGGVHWQVAEGEDFSTVVFDRRVVSASDSIVVTEDEMTVPYLTAGTEYYWRARYFDLKDTDSDWSDVWGFETSASAVTETILQPDILYPPNEGWMPEKKLLVQVSQPVSLGTLAPDTMDLQVSMTPDFEALDILKDYQDQTDTRLLLDDTADFSTAPSPLYLRARQKDSANSVASAWSAVPTVWLRRVFKDIIFGVDEVLLPGSAVLRMIDESGNFVTAGIEYYDDNPIYAGITTNVVASGQDMAFIPPFYIKFWRDPEDENHTR
jgi:hypothetical protein